MYLRQNKNNVTKIKQSPVCILKKMVKSFRTFRINFLLQGYAPPPKNGIEQKRPGRPLNITSLVRLSSAVPNQISISWASEIGKVRIVFLGRKKACLHWKLISFFRMPALYSDCLLL